MSVYLVDFENVTSEGLSGVDKLSEGDKVILFYSTKANKISMPIHVEMSKSLASFEYKEASVGGKNALDYQLSTYLGYLIGQKEDTSFYIVSKDRGYEYLSDFWKQTLGETKEQIRIELIGAIKEVKIEGNEQVAESHQVQKAEVREDISENAVIKENEVIQETAYIEVEEKTLLASKNNNINKKCGIKKTSYFNKRQAENKKAEITKAEVTQKPNDSKTSIVVRENVFSSSESTKKKSYHNVEVEKQLRQLIDKELQEDQVKRIVQYFKQAKNKQELHRKIVKVLGQDRGTVIYHRIKKLVKDKEA